MLVVLALIGVVVGAVGLALGPATRGASAHDEAELLATRMRRASEEALASGAPVALVWTETGYRFVALRDGEWAPHPVPLLAAETALGGSLRFEEPGAFAVTADDLPATGEPLLLRLGPEGGGQGLAVAWDGATARVEAPGT